MKRDISTRRWQEIKRLFDAALARDVTSRAALVERACDGDPELRAEVESLLQSHERAPEFLDTPAAELLDDEHDESLIGRSVGPYRIVRRIASGGMGTVYFAERADDAYRKHVAIKFIRGGVSSAAGVRRFVEERQALANLDHPSIAKLLDGGTNEDGRPYLVMEYVEGIPIDAYCKTHRLGVEDRLRLFLRVCDAVYHAHQNLVVHRDLKPANILVTADGLPKLLDFGIATLADRSASHSSFAGGREATLPFVTPGYASPEQIRAEPTTVASDVYSLGVILYELLTGRRPWDVDARSQPGVERGELQPPSRISRRTSEDLDAIVLRALRAQPAGRYPSVDHLADDIRRYLEDLPVTARAQTVGYRASKFVRRHRIGAAAAALVLASLSVGVVGTAWQGHVARRERDAEQAQRKIAEANLRRALVADQRAEQQTTRALHQAQISDHVTGFLVDLFRTADPWKTGGAGVTARQLLDRGAESMSDDRSAPPEVRSALLVAMGRVYTHLGLYDRAKDLLHAAVDLGRFRLGADDPLLASGLDALGTAYSRSGEWASAEAAFREALEITGRSTGDRGAQAATLLNNIGLVREAQGDLASADRLFREALGIRREAGSADGEAVSNALNNLGGVCFTRGQYARAERFFRSSLAIQRSLLTADHPSIALALNNVALARQGQGDLDEAEQLHRHALEIRQRRLGPDHPDVAGSLNNFASVLYMKGNAEAAGALFQRALRLVRGRLGDDHPTVIQLECNLGAVMYSSGDDNEAERLWRDVLERRRRLLPGSHPQIAEPLALLAEVRIRQDDPRGAETLLHECLAIRRAAYPRGHPAIADAESLFGAALLAEGRFAEAERLLVPSFDILRSALGADLRGISEARNRVVDLYRRWGKPDLASRFTEAVPPR